MNVRSRERGKHVTFRLQCEFCTAKYDSCRSNGMYCSDACRCAAARENAKFEMPVIPKSGVPGITYDRRGKFWTIRVKLSGERRWKYVGCHKDLDTAIKFQREVIGQ